MFLFDLFKVIIFGNEDILLLGSGKDPEKFFFSFQNLLSLGKNLKD
jgi:hypothetical protein